jgi:hypothetical protein
MAWRYCSRAPLFVFVLVRLVLAARTARAADDGVKERCLSAYVEAQRLRDAGRLLESRTPLARCANDPCPQALQPDCSRWLADVDRVVPSVVFDVRDAGGGEITDVRVYVDGRPLLERLDGRPIDVNPGEHVFRFEPSGRAALERRVVVRAGEKARSIAVALPAPAEPQRVEARRPFPWLAVSLGGVSLLGLVGTTYFGLSYLDTREGQACAPRCTADDERDVEQKARLANVSAAVFALAGGALAVVLLARSSDRPRPSAVR